MASGSNKAANAAEIDRLALALAKEPGSKAFIPLAEEYGKAGMWEEAAAVLEDGLKTYPNFIIAMVALGRTYDQMNQPVKAMAILEEAIKLSPENLRAHRTLAKIYIAQGAKDAALRSCSVILAINPQDQEALSLRAALGEPTVPSSAKPSRQSRERQVGKPKGRSSLPFKEAAQSRPAKSEPVTLEGDAPPVAGAKSPQEELAVMANIVASMSDERRSATVSQLEQWLASIQANRRDRANPA